MSSVRRPGRRAAAVLLALVAVGLLALLLAGRSRSSKHSEPTAGARCEGATALCQRRLNEVVFAGTHNSYAASDEPGWYFATVSVTGSHASCGTASVRC